IAGAKRQRFSGRGNSLVAWTVGPGFPSPNSLSPPNSAVAEVWQSLLPQTEKTDFGGPAKLAPPQTGGWPAGSGAKETAGEDAAPHRLLHVGDRLGRHRRAWLGRDVERAWRQLVERRRGGTADAGIGEDRRSGLRRDSDPSGRGRGSVGRERAA